MICSRRRTSSCSFHYDSKSIPSRDAVDGKGKVYAKEKREGETDQKR